MRSVLEAPIDWRVLHGFRIIEANRPADVRELAQTVNLSPSHLRHLFKNAMGCLDRAIRDRTENAACAASLSDNRLGREADCD
jgi:methylphosphotriester-DNA--protein-cysteine methyltransferase